MPKSVKRSVIKQEVDGTVISTVILIKHEVDGTVILIKQEVDGTVILIKQEVDGTLIRPFTILKRSPCHKNRANAGPLQAQRVHQLLAQGYLVLHLNNLERCISLLSSSNPINNKLLC